MREPEEGMYDARAPVRDSRPQTYQPPPIKMASSMSSYNSANGASIGSYGSGSLPPSALRVGKYDVSGRKMVQPQMIRPLLDLSIIYDVFGEDATLYHVLGIKPSADEAEIRRAYLSQGRATLFNGDFDFSAEETPRNLDDVPEVARKKFQAVSVAYQILSTHELRRDYDAWGVVYAPANTVESMSRRNSVSWKAFVEEKVITDSHPDEHHRPRSTDSPRKQDQGHGWLESQFRGFDEDAEKFLRGDLLDGLDESFTSLQKSFGSFIRNIGSDAPILPENEDKNETENEDGVVQGIVDDVIPVAIEGEQNRKPSLTNKLRSKRHIFRKEPKITVQPYHEPQQITEPSEYDNVMKENESSSLHSPCSILMCFENVTDTTDGAGGCGGFPFGF